ncbi:hypothetical protein ACFQ6N_37395 [Kitasatospora sp. NPDC056446]|uniref:hypothetical protein n=1 Tax=Kitasatospora sp. NPDC056446 TaxID=3345819 RepID=UPI00368859DE
MTDYQCGSCSYGSNDPGELRQHSRRTGHVGIRKEDGVETPGAGEAAEEAAPTEGRSGRGRVAARAGFVLLAAVSIGALAWRNKELLAELTESAAENEYLKSASGAGTTLNGYRGR